MINLNYVAYKYKILLFHNNYLLILIATLGKVKSYWTTSLPSNYSTVVIMKLNYETTRFSIKCNIIKKLSDFLKDLTDNTGFFISSRYLFLSITLK